MRMAVSGTFSLGLRTNVLPQTSATGYIQSGTIAGKLNGVMPDAHAERLADGVAVDAARDVGQDLAHQQGRDAAGEFHHFDAPAHVAARFDQGLAVFAGDALREFLEGVFEVHLETEENAGALGGRGVSPGGERGGGGFHGVVDHGETAQRGLGDDLAP